MMSSLKPKFINICHFTSHCFSNLCYPNNNIGWLVLSKQKCQQRHDEASYIKLSCQKLSNGNYDLFIYLFKFRLWVYLKKHLRYYRVWKSFYKQYLISIYCSTVSAISFFLAHSGHMMSSASVINPFPTIDALQEEQTKQLLCQCRPSKDINRVPPIPRWWLEC